MEELTPVEVKILKILSKNADGFTDKYIGSKLKITKMNASHLLYDLQTRNLTERMFTNEDKEQKLSYATGNWTITDNGKLTLFQYKAIVKKQNRAKWEERIWGIIVGIAIGILVGYVLFINKWN